MKRLAAKLLAAVALPVFSTALASDGAEAHISTPPHRQYGVWTSARLGGGGYLQRASWCAADTRRVYLATDVGGVYRSDNGGHTWTMLNGALPPGEASCQVRGVLAHPKLPDTVLIAIGSQWSKDLGVFRSDDAGASFRRVLVAHFEGNDATRAMGDILVGSPGAPETVYACPVGLGPQRSNDFGLTWRDLGLHDVYPRDFVADRANPRRFWLVAAPHRALRGGGREFDAGLWRSDDAGESWQCLDTAVIPREMVQDPFDAELLHGLFTEPPQLRRSRDGGRSWEPYANPDILPPPRGSRDDGTYGAIAAGPDFVVVGGNGGSFYRLDAGSDEWRRLPRPDIRQSDWYAAETQPIESHFGAALGFVGVEPGHSAHWLFTDWYACYLSSDAGASWDLAIDGIEMAVLHCVAQDPSNPRRVHAGMADIGYFRSDDGGASYGHWGRLRGISNNIKSLSVCAAHPSRVYATGPSTWKWMANQTFRSDDGGDSWRRPAQRGLPSLTEQGGARCNTIVVHPDHPDEVYIAMSGAVAPGAGGVWRSVNGGDDWEWFSQGMAEGVALFRESIWTTGAELAVSPDGTLVAMSHDTGRAFRRATDAEIWEEVRLPGRSWAVVADPLRTGRFYAARREAGLWRSEDGGVTWVCIVDGPAFAVAADSAMEGRIAWYDGVDAHVSADAGATARPVGLGLPFRDRRNVIGFAGNRVIVGTGGSGLFSAPVPVP